MRPRRLARLILPARLIRQPLHMRQAPPKAPLRQPTDKPSCHIPLNKPARTGPPPRAAIKVQSVSGPVYVRIVTPALGLSFHKAAHNPD